MRRLLIATALISLPCFADLQIAQVAPDGEHTVTGFVDAGTAAPGDSLETRYRIHNTGAGPATVQTILVAGSGFKLTSPPVLPYILAPGAAVDFRVTFSPTTVGSYSANVTVNTATLILRGTASPSVDVIADQATLASGALIDFGKAERGGTVTKTVQIANSSKTALTVSSLIVSGAGFQITSGVALPHTLAPGDSLPITLSFSPALPQPATGTLTVNQRSFALAGSGFDPPLPATTLLVDNNGTTSSKQPRLSIPLASAARSSGTGLLTLEFHPTATGSTDDPAVRFLTGPARTASIQINPGDTLAKISSQNDIGFQTGTTAGTIVFTLTVGSTRQQISLVINPAPVSLDTATAVRRTNDIDVNLIGFDNTHAVSTFAFTFYDTNGKALPAAPVQVNAASQFRIFFDTAGVGGLFALRATFPVTGDATQVGGVQVDVTNPAGVTHTDRLTFQ